MPFKYQTTNFNSIVLLPYLVPKALKSQNLYEAFIRVRKKKEVDLEFKALALSKTEQRMNLFNRLENRFDVFKIGLPSEGQSFTFRFKSLEVDFRTLHFSDRKKQLKNLSSYVFAYNARKYLLKNDRKIVQARFLAFSKNQWKLSFSGQSAFLRTKQKRKVSSHLQVISNVKKVGLLDFCHLNNWKLEILNKTAKSESAVKDEKEISYYNDLSFQSFLFMKRRIIKAKRKKVKEDMSKLKIKKKTKRLITEAKIK